MTSRALSLLLLTGIGLAAVGTTIGTLRKHTGPAPVGATSSSPARTNASADSFKLTSTSIDLPSDDTLFPGGANADVINANCTICHSASMALLQPALSAEQWTATVTKMREIYHAPVQEKDVPAIVAYLVAMPGQKAGPPTGKAQDPDPKAAPRTSGMTLKQTVLPSSTALAMR